MVSRFGLIFESMVPPDIPKSILVIGSGAIGIEFASFYQTLGVEVTVVEVLPTIMPVEDTEISGIARKQMEKQGMKILTEAKVVGVKKDPKSVSVTVETKDGGKGNYCRRKSNISCWCTG